MNIIESEETEQSGVWVLSLSGRLDPVGGPELEKFCSTRMSREKPFLILDMAGVNYISSAGLRSILSLVKLLEGFGGNMTLCALQPTAAKVIGYACFDGFLKIFATKQEAHASFSAVS